MGSGRPSSRIEGRAWKQARPSWILRRRTWVGYVFILPWFVSFLWFDAIPFVLNVYFSLTDFSVGSRVPEWVGLDNFRDILTNDPLILESLYNTAYYALLSVPLLTVLALVLALLLNLKIRLRSVYRTVYYIPSLVPVVAASVIWLILFRTNDGMVNTALSLVGISPIHWLTSPDWAKPALVLMSLWGFGAPMVIYLAGLQGIPEHLYEAAAIDGAGRWANLVHITIPLITPVIYFNLLMGMISSFQVFTSAFVMTSGGPLNSTLFYVLYLYNNAFGFFKMGYASAMALLLFVIILTLTLLANGVSDRWVFYGDQ